MVQCEKPRLDFPFGKVGWPTVGGENGFIELAMGVGEPLGGWLQRLVRVRGLRSSSDALGGLSHKLRKRTSSRAASAMALTRAS